jgi:hypothetical protein
MYSMTKNKLTTTLGAALLAGFVTGTSVWAGEASLVHNERAAQNSIVDTTQSRPIFNDRSVATLAHNEDAARRAFFDANALVPTRASGATGEAKLWHNEMAARRSIAGASVSEEAIRRNSAPLGAASAAGY